MYRGLGLLMTLILAIAKKEYIVVAADGYEFTQDAGEPRILSLSNRQKIFPLLGRNIVLAIHGQNRITSAGKGLDSQRLVGDILDGLSSELSTIQSVEGIAQRINDLLTPDVTHTFRLLQSDNNHHSSLGVCVYGFDSDDSRSKAFESYWPMITDQDSTPYVIRHIQEKDDVRFIYSGSGKRYAESIANNRAMRLHPDYLRKAPISKAQKHIRKLYKDSFQMQPKSNPEFGGHYHEVTITKGQTRWTVLPA